MQPIGQQPQYAGRGMPSQFPQQPPQNMMMQGNRLSQPAQMPMGMAPQQQQQYAQLNHAQGYQPQQQQQPQARGFTQQPYTQPQNMPPQQRTMAAQQPPPQFAQQHPRPPSFAQPGMPPQQQLQQQPTFNVPARGGIQQQPFLGAAPRPSSLQPPPSTPPRTTNAPPPQFAARPQPGSFPGFSPALDTPGHHPNAPPQPNSSFGAPPPPTFNNFPTSASTMLSRTVLALDLVHQCPTAYARLSVKTFPDTEQTDVRSGSVTLGAIFHPFNEQGPPIPIVNFGHVGVVRCRKCRSYVSPFSIWVENGRRWQCTVCWNINDTETDYYCELDPQTGQRRDKMSRPELHAGIIDILAPEEYSLRPPPPTTYFFVIDVSRDALVTGMVQCVAQAIKRSLPRLAGAPRTRFGLLTFGSEVHFYDVSGGSKGTAGPRMLVVTDLISSFRPLSSDSFLFDLAERQHNIEALLDALPTMHNANLTRGEDACLGPALRAAFDILQDLGGKISLFQTQLPMQIIGVGSGAPTAATSGKTSDDNDKSNYVVPTDDSLGGIPKPGRGADGRTLGGPREHEFLQPGTDWYVKRALDFSKYHVSVDLYVCSSRYCDVASVSDISHLTSGKIRYYPFFHERRDGERLGKDIERSLTTVMALEAVMRVRATSGVKITRFYGSFSTRNRDLLAIPCADVDDVFTMEFGYGASTSYDEEILTGKHLTIQSAFLHTTTSGERRIRVTNQCIPISNNPAEIVAGVDAQVMAALWFKRACEDARVGGLEGARGALRASFSRLTDPTLRERLAGFVVGAMKSTALRGGTDVSFDERICMLRLIGRANVTRCESIASPKMYSVLLNGKVDMVPCTRNSLNQAGVFLLDNGLQFIIWIGSRAPKEFAQALFDVPELNGIDAGLLKLSPPAPHGESPIKMSVWNVVHEARKNRWEDFAQVLVVREGDKAEARLYWGLYLDAATFRGGEVGVEELLRGGGGGGAPMPPQPGRAMQLPHGGGMMMPSVQQQQQQQQMQQQQQQPHPMNAGMMPPRGAPTVGAMQQPAMQQPGPRGALPPPITIQQPVIMQPRGPPTMQMMGGVQPQNAMMGNNIPMMNKGPPTQQQQQPVGMPPPRGNLPPPQQPQMTAPQQQMARQF